jgi:hypothetical protein
MLSNDEVISARLIVLANGLNIGLRHLLKIERRIVSECHSITLAFDLAPVGRAAFAFPALTYYPERSSDRMAYLTLFPISAAMRANLMVYRKMDDPWLRRFREAPEATMAATMPGLRRIAGEFKVAGPIKIRPADLYVTEGHRQAGIVLVGDAFATSCPAAGTDKVFTDVERLCNVHIPNWLASDGMGAEKIAAFYDDPAKAACDAWSTGKAYHLRSLTTDSNRGPDAGRGFWHGLGKVRCGGCVQQQARSQRLRRRRRYNSRPPKPVSAGWRSHSQSIQARPIRLLALRPTRSRQPIGRSGGPPLPVRHRQGRQRQAPGAQHIHRSWGVQSLRCRMAPTVIPIP